MKPRSVRSIASHMTQPLLGFVEIALTAVIILIVKHEIPNLEFRSETDSTYLPILRSLRQDSVSAVGLAMNR